MVEVKTFERFFNQRIDREKGSTVDTVEDKILAAVDSIITPEIKLANR